MFWRLRAVVRSVRKAGVRATWVALRAWRHGAVQNVAELAELIRLVSERRLDGVLEVGTQDGGTYWAWCRVATDTAAVVSIDLPVSDERRARLGGYARRTQSQALIQADSHDPWTVRQVDLFRGSIDLLFIDGDHSYEGVRADFENYAPLVKRGGLIAFHDIVARRDPSCQVDRLWGQLRDLYDTREIVDAGCDEQRGLFGIGVLFWHGDEDLVKWHRLTGHVQPEPAAPTRIA